MFNKRFSRKMKKEKFCPHSHANYDHDSDMRFCPNSVSNCQSEYEALQHVIDRRHPLMEPQNAVCRYNDMYRRTSGRMHHVNHGEHPAHSECSNEDDRGQSRTMHRRGFGRMYHIYGYEDNRTDCTHEMQSECSDKRYHMMGPRGGRMHGGSHGGGFGHHGHQPPFLRGRKFSADELQLFLLGFLQEKDSYGYELIKRFTERSSGFYTPSPGVIYPALAYLEDVSYVAVKSEGTRKSYSLSPQGIEFLTQNKELLEALFAKLDHFARQMDSVNQAMQNEHSHYDPALMDALKQLRMQLHRYHNSDEQTQRKAAEILQQTLTQLLALKP